MHLRDVSSSARCDAIHPQMHTCMHDPHMHARPIAIWHKMIDDKMIAGDRDKMIADKMIEDDR